MTLLPGPRSPNPGYPAGTIEMMVTKKGVTCSAGQMRWDIGIGGIGNPKIRVRYHCIALIDGGTARGHAICAVGQR